MGIEKKLVIIGAGGHGRVVADVAKLCGYNEMIFLDDGASPLSSGRISDYPIYRDSFDFIVAIGNNSVRRRLQSELSENGCTVVALVHPSAVIGSGVVIGKGTVVMAGAVINADAVIGEGVIVNTSSSVDHDCRVGDFCHISVGARLAGTVSVGDNTMISAGAVVINNTNVCNDCIIGAGAVVIADIAESGLYIGVPAAKKVSS